MDVENMEKVLFITGASSGIGRATAIAAIDSGWRLGIMSRNKDALVELQGTLGADKVDICVGDATQLAAQYAAVEQVVERFGRIDAAFANAGVGINTPGTENGDPKEWERMLAININGVLWTAKATLPHLRKHKGHFLVTGSMAGRSYHKGSIYSSSKWFVRGFALNLAAEMDEWGGRCTEIAPGMVNTAFFDTPKPDKLMPEDIAASVMFALNAPARANVREIFVMPTEHPD
ncbi:MAG: SDR family oxidoreductase [Cyanobacteria bacterium J06635_11]